VNNAGVSILKVFLDAYLNILDVYLATESCASCMILLV